MKNNIKYGLQMFGCSSDFKKDPDYFFKTMSGYGYKTIEPCIVFDEEANLQTWFGTLTELPSM